MIKEVCVYPGPFGHEYLANLCGEITTVVCFKLLHFLHSIQYLKLIDVSPSKPSFSSSYTRKVARFLNLPPLWVLPAISWENVPCLREEVAGLGVWWFDDDYLKWIPDVFSPLNWMELPGFTKHQTPQNHKGLHTQTYQKNIASTGKGCIGIGEPIALHFRNSKVWCSYKWIQMIFCLAKLFQTMVGWGVLLPIRIPGSPCWFSWMSFSCVSLLLGS